jgi:hypothetical protein
MLSCMLIVLYVDNVFIMEDNVFIMEEKLNSAINHTRTMTIASIKHANE